MSIQTNIAELQVAEILLQLHCGLRGAPAGTNGPKLSPPDHKMEVESAAALFLSRLATTVTPPTTAQVQPAAIYVPNSQKNKRDQETQTDTDEVPRSLILPEIAQRDSIIKSLFARIRLLEDQLRALGVRPETLSPNSVTELDPDVSTDLLQIQTFREDTRICINNKKSKKRSFFNTTDTTAKDTDASDDEWRPEEKKPSRKSLFDTPQSQGTDMIPIGEGYATVPKRLLKQIDWNSYTGATRKLLTAVFSRRVLATHSLTGKPSPAFPGKPAKKRLEPELVNDIVQVVVKKCGVPESVVRTSITTKCADESKMYRSRQQNKKKSYRCKINQENDPPSPSGDSSDQE